MAPVLGWDEDDIAREVEHYLARVAAERDSQEQPDDHTADAARLGAPDVRTGAARTTPPGRVHHRGPGLATLDRRAKPSTTSRQEGRMPDFVGAIDQGTTSTRFIIFDHDGTSSPAHQLEHEQILPRPGWVEHDPLEIWRRTEHVIGGALGPGAADGGRPRRGRHHQPAGDHRGVGPPDRAALHNAIVWQDTRTDRIAAALERDGRGDVIRERAGLPPAAYFSGGKLQWLLENVDGLRERGRGRRVAFGTTDSWLLWNLTGGRRRRARHRPHQRQPHDADGPAAPWTGTTSYSASSAYPAPMLPQIRPSSDPGCYGRRPAAGPVPWRGAVRRHPRGPAGRNVRPGLLRGRAGQEHLRHRQLPAAQHRTRDRPIARTGWSPPSATSSATKPVYALEGSIAVTGSRDPVAA